MQFQYKIFLWHFIHEFNYVFYYQISMVFLSKFPSNFIKNEFTGFQKKCLYAV